MNQKKIIIVGASSGIGYDIASKYVSKGHMVGITGRRNNLLNELKEKFPTQIFIACFDVTKNENEQQIVQLINSLGGLDLLIYNAGFGELSLNLKWEVENEIVKTNVNGFTEIVVYAFNYFAQQGFGHIAVTSSIAALRGNSWSPAYSASKAFISNYAEALSVKAWRMKKNICVTDIKPGFIDTKMAKGDRKFWVSSSQKAAEQIIVAIQKKKRIVYITKRWWLIAQFMKFMPYAIYKRLA